MKTRFSAGHTLLLGWLMVGCSSYPGSTLDEAPREANVGEVKAGLWLAAGASLWPAGNVPVCFLPGLSAAKRTLIRTVIEDEWERAANIDFGGWVDCPTLTNATSNVLAIGVGPVLAGFEGESRHCADGNQSSCTGGAGRAVSGNFNRVNFLNENVIARYLIMHEAGHALGFEHETISDAPPGTQPNCAQTTSVTAPGATSLENEGDRANSVMDQFMGDTVNGNGCAVNPQTLSNWDVLGARRAYGRKPAGSIVGFGGMCLNIQAASTALGTPVIGWSCKGLPNDTFQHSFPFLQSKMPTPNTRCLNVNGGMVSTSSGTPLTSWSCISQANEQFSYSGSQWRAMGKMCIAAASTSVGAQLSLQKCDPAATLQKWDFFETIGDTNRRIRLNGTNRCVEVPPGAGLGTRLALGFCSSPSQENERFTFVSGGTIVPDSAAGLCANVLGGSASPGSALGLWNGCSLSPVLHNAAFTVQGTIKSMDQCVDMFGGVAFDGVGIGVYPCVPGAPNEQWEYVW